MNSSGLGRNQSKAGPAGEGSGPGQPCPLLVSCLFVVTVSPSGLPIHGYHPLRFSGKQVCLHKLRTFGTFLGAGAISVLGTIDSASGHTMVPPLLQQE